MRIQSIACVLLGVFFAMTVSACALNSDENLGTSASSEDLLSSKVDDESATWGDASAETTSSTSFSNEAVTQANGCSIVQWCNAPGSEGTVCKQLGCSEQAAENECFVESHNVCGTPRCPWIFVTLDGRRLNHVSCP